MTDYCVHERQGGCVDCRVEELERAMCECRHRLMTLSAFVEGQERRCISEAVDVLTLALAGCDTYDDELNLHAQHSPKGVTP